MAIFYALRHRSRLDLRAVLTECERRLDDLGCCAAERTAIQEQAVDALRAFADAHEGRLPASKQEYESWRKLPKAPLGLPSEYKIRYAFGGAWRVAISCAAGGEPVSVVAARQIRAQGSAYTRDELIAALREFDADPHAGRRRWVDYVRWARGVRAKDPSRRLPLSPSTFAQHDGYLVLCREAGVHACGAGAVLERHYEGPELLEAVRQAWAELECSVYMSASAYRAWRDRRRTVQLEGDAPPEQVPSAGYLAKRFGSWPDVLLAAGLISQSVRDERVLGKRTAYVASEVGLRILREAMAEEGDDISPTAFDLWRRRRLETNPAEVPPCSRWFAGRFDGFPAARERARKDLEGGSDER